MKRVLSILLFFFGITVAGEATYYWDYPRYLGRSTEGSIKSDVKVLKSGRNHLVFFLVHEKKESFIQFYSTENFREFQGPFSTHKKIEIKEGFFPSYDVQFHDGGLFLIWNTLNGNIHLSRSSDSGETWSGDRIVVEPENFTFDLKLTSTDSALSLFYHTESEGRRIDFFYIVSENSGEGWMGPFQVARGYAGSFFPSMFEYNGRFFIVWQSRPFTKTGAPVFDIYFSRADSLKSPWSSPVDLTDNRLGEDIRPQLFFNDDRFSLVWECDSEGAWGIYYREFDLEGNPLSGTQKVNKSILNAKNAQILSTGEGLYIFYIDERDGNQRLYYTVRRNGSFEEFGPLGIEGTDIIDHLPLQSEGNLYVIWQDEVGLVVAGPDRAVQPVKIIPPKWNYIGLNGIRVEWVGPRDSSGIEGYCYYFNRNEFDEPEIVNLSPQVSSLKISAEEEGTYYLHLRVMDKAGNYSRIVTLPLTVDLTPPPAPDINPVTMGEDGFYMDNSPAIDWSVEASDVVGYNYQLAKEKITIDTPRIRTELKGVKFHRVEGGTWVFSVAAVDRAGNVSDTSHIAMRLKPLPKLTGEEMQSVPAWIIGKQSFSASPFLNISLYIVLGGLIFIAFYITADVLEKYREESKGVPMETGKGMVTMKNKRLGLRFKFSILIGVLVLGLTIGISSVLGVVTIEQEKRALANQMIEKAKLSLENMTNVAREGILNNDELLLLSVIAKTMEIEDIKYSVILDVDNRVIAHSDIGERGKILTDEFTRQASASTTVLINPDFSPDTLEILYNLASPVTFAGRRIGTVMLGHSTESIFMTIREARKKSIVNTVIITLITIIVGIAGAIVMATVTIKPIKVLAEGANIVGGGNLNYRIHVKARDEIGLLADEFNRMTARLLVYQKEMAQKAKLDEQLEIARNIQQDLIPQSGIETDDLSIDGFYKAAVGVGGDYYDFIEIDEGIYGLIMSDVAGKGVPASLMMIMIRTIFKSLIHSGVNEPSRVVTLMNSTLASDISSDRFATLLFGVFNRKNRMFRYANAGYGPLMVYKADKNGCFLVNPPTASVPIGVMPDVGYNEEDPIQLDAGDAIFLFTDGIHEARNRKNQEYGMKRLADVIPNFADRGSGEIAHFILKDVLKFAGKTEQYDDMTLLVMKLK